MTATAAAEIISRASSVLVFTGAGISTGSGIPDFRGPQGIWKTRRPIYFQEFMSSEDARIAHWEYKLESHEVFSKARPNAAHLALVELERLGFVQTLVTQNIDGLHQDAGTSPQRIIEIHGTNRKVRCMSCDAISEPEPALDEFRKLGRCPRCPCGGFLKTATISFGQSMPEAELARAFEAARSADVVIAIGSTLEVQPAALVPYAAHQSGAKYIIVNRGETAHDALATLRLEGDAVELVPEIVRSLKLLQPS